MIATGFDSAIERAVAEGHTNLARRIRIERRMARTLVNTCLKRGFVVSVNDSEEWVVKRSTDRREIMAALFSSDQDRIQIRGGDGDDARPAGWFDLIYGNDGPDVVSDYSATPVCDAIWEEVLRPLAERIECGRARP